MVGALDPEARTARVDITAKFNGQTVLGKARATGRRSPEPSRCPIIRAALPAPIICAARMNLRFGTQ